MPEGRFLHPHGDNGNDVQINQQGLRGGIAASHHQLGIEDRLSNIITMTIYSTLDKANCEKLRTSMTQLAGIDLLSKENLVARPDLFEQTLYLVIGPAARLIFERVTRGIMKEFANITPYTNQYGQGVYKDWGDYSRLVSAIKNTADPSIHYA